MSPAILPLPSRCTERCMPRRWFWLCGAAQTFGENVSSFPQRCKGAIRGATRKGRTLFSAGALRLHRRRQLRNLDPTVRHLRIDDGRARRNRRRLRPRRVLQLFHREPFSFSGFMVARRTLVVHVFRRSLVFRSAARQSADLARFRDCRASERAPDERRAPKIELASAAATGWRPRPSEATAPSTIVEPPRPSAATLDCAPLLASSGSPSPETIGVAAPNQGPHPGGYRTSILPREGWRWRPRLGPRG